MEVVVCRAPGNLCVEQRPVPPRHPGEVLIRIRRIGICGTDLHIYSGNQPYLEYPRVPGHELAGEVAESDAGSIFAVGARVCVMPYLSCGSCRACLNGKTNCCRKMQVLGVHRDGGLAEYLVVPEAFVIDAAELSLDDAAMVEFLAIGRHAVGRANVLSGNNVLVVGAGAIGIGTAYFARAAGAEVTICDLRTERLAFCKDQLGLNAVLAGPTAEERLFELSKGEYFDVVFDATGSKAAMEAGFQYVAHGGSYVLLSIVNHDIQFSDPEFHKREMTLMGSRNATREDFLAVIDALRKQDVPTAHLRTHKSTLVDLPNHIDVWARPQTGVIKAIVSA